MVEACVQSWKQPFEPDSAGRISLALPILRLYSSTSHSALSSEQESELVEATRHAST